MCDLELKVLGLLATCFPQLARQPTQGDGTASRSPVIKSRLCELITTRDGSAAKRSPSAASVLNGTRYLIHDRDPLFTEAFRDVLGTSGVRTVKLPARSPNLNAYAERFVRSIKSECLARIIPLGERHLRTAVNEYTEHYHLERNHQGLKNELIEDRRGAIDMSGDVKRHERLGGILNYYDRRAA
jgi:hypothetical protein